MTALDWVIVAFTALLAVYGYRQGFVVGALSLVGFVLGALVGTRLAPLLLHRGAASPYAPLFGLAGALLAGGVFASGLEGVGGRLRAMLRIPGFGALDGLLGAALTACVALGIAWIVSAVALQSTSAGPWRTDLRDSRILRALDRLLPPSGPVLDALARFDPLPSVHGPAADVRMPTGHILRTPGVRAAGRSVVRVYGTACGLGVEGSGWVAAPGIVVTNAHVVAGEATTRVQVGGIGRGLPAAVVRFDTHDDIAILRVADLRPRALHMAGNPSSGTAAAILGYPLDGAFDAEPGRLGQTETVRTQDAYGENQVLRRITALRGRVRPGNSGGPMVDAQGEVVATVFAAITGASRPGGFAVPDALVAGQLRRAGTRPVGTGHCAA
ncbi:MAG: MarP family serine protease [Solirubrobacterales bacterium]|nr:MarP family serine protease [Solirubrobacterales bacterium]